MLQQIASSACRVLDFFGVQSRRTVCLSGVQSNGLPFRGVVVAVVVLVLDRFGVQSRQTVCLSGVRSNGLPFRGAIKCSAF